MPMRSVEKPLSTKIMYILFDQYLRAGVSKNAFSALAKVLVWSRYIILWYYATDLYRVSTSTTTKSRNKCTNNTDIEG